MRRVTRRRFLLSSAAALGAGTFAAAGRLAMTSEASEGKPAGEPAPQQWAMVIDLRKCEGCVTQDGGPACVEACNAAHFVPADQQWLRLFQVETSGGSYFLPRPCMQCENAPCVNVCPVGASYHDEHGVVLINHDRCIGCRFCMAACPYGARSFNWEQPENPPGMTFAEDYSPEFPVPHRRGTVEKCMLCAHRATEGVIPACAEECPMNAIYLGDLTEDIATNGSDVVKLSRFLAQNSAVRLKEELGTRPRVWYIPGYGQDYGRGPDDERQAMPARTWQEQRADDGS